MSDIIRVETTQCPQCGEFIRLAFTEDGSFGEDRYDGIWSLVEKLQHHMETDKTCVREAKLNELLK